MLWIRTEREAPELFAGGHGPFRFKDTPASPSYECADGLWFKMMGPHEAALEALGEDPAALRSERATESPEARRAYFADVRAIYKRQPRAFWMERFLAQRFMAFETQSVEEGFEDPQVNHNGAVIELDLPEIGRVKQFGFAWQLERNEAAIPTPPPAMGQHTQEVLASLGTRPPTPAPTRASARPSGHALEGIRVLDLGHPFAGAWGPMILADLGADVLIVEPLGVTRANALANRAAMSLDLNNVWLGCQRGKRCITLDLSTPEGQDVLRTLIAGADIIHTNRGRGVCKSFLFDYETAKAINPRIIYCHTTAYGETGPNAGWQGVDQLAEGRCGLEWEQGAVPAGAPGPQWYRFGLCDHGNAYQSIVAVLQALYHRDRTGEGQYVHTCILNSGMLYASDAFIAPAGGQDASPDEQGPDRSGGPLYRLYQTSHGWIFIVAVREAEWQALCRGLGQVSLADDPRFATVQDRERNADALTGVLAPLFRERTAAEWFDALDRAGAPCEISEEGYGQGYGFFDNPDAIANDWVAKYEHYSMGMIEQPGKLFSLSETPGAIWGPPPVRGRAQSRGPAGAGLRQRPESRSMREKGVTTWPS